MFNILYRGEILHSDLTHEEVTEVLDKLASQFYDTGEYNPNEIELEELNNGTSS